MMKMENGKRRKKDEWKKCTKASFIKRIVVPSESRVYIFCIHLHYELFGECVCDQTRFRIYVTLCILAFIVMRNWRIVNGKAQRKQSLSLSLSRCLERCHWMKFNGIFDRNRIYCWSIEILRKLCCELTFILKEIEWDLEWSMKH